jgi:hypothetical protein
MTKKTFSLVVSGLWLALTFSHIAFGAQEPKAKNVDTALAQTTVTAQELNIKDTDAALTSTAFTYQGQLKDASGPVTGTFDFQFVLYPAQTGAEPLGTSEMKEMALSNGLFRFKLDFGRAAREAQESWLDIGVRPSGSAEAYTVLFPRQKLTPTPYAIFAQHEQWSLIGVPVGFADRAVIDKVAPVSTTDEADPSSSVEAKPLAGSETTKESISAAEPEQVGGWTDDGAVVRLTTPTDRVGIGTTTPNHSLSIIGGPLWTSNQWAGSIELGNGAAMGWQTNTAGQRFGMGHTNGGFYLFRTTSNPGAGSAPAIYDFALTDAGNVGIGTGTPTAGYRLEVIGATRLVSNTSNNGEVQFGSPSGETGMTILRGSGRADLRFEGSTVKLLAGPVGGPPSSANGIAITTSGNVGIGTNTPGFKLDVSSNSSTAIVGRSTFSGGVGVYGESAQFNGVRGVGRNVNHGAVVGVHEGGGIAVYGTSRGTAVQGDSTSATGFGGYFRNTSGGIALGVEGMARVGVLQITGGGDIAEPFEITDAEAIRPGMVVAIDPNRPGQLQVSGKAYDRTVAGIISGANGINPGLTMRQEGSIADGAHPVALTGRVYGWADASNGPIEPGDLLTTSDTPGHAMKVTRHAKAQGAIIGKAMTSLKSGRGLVLVLVTLQ